MQKIRRKLEETTKNIQDFLSLENNNIYLQSGVQFVFKLTHHYGYRYSHLAPELEVMTSDVRPVQHHAQVEVPTFVQFHPQQGMAHNNSVYTEYAEERPFLYSNNA
ncbi:histone acetyltransferase type B catalytic subunit [Acrasis kona]